MEESGKRNQKNAVDIIIVGWNHLELTAKCIKSIQANTTSDKYQIIYVDNGSEGVDALIAVMEVLEVRSLIHVLLPRNTGYCHGYNVGLALSLLTNSEYVLLLNNDTEIPEGDSTWLKRLSQPMREHPEIGAVGAVSDGVAQPQMRQRSGNGVLLSPALIFFCVLLRKAAIEQVGLLDERFDPDGNWSDFDYSLRLAQHGWKLAIAESVWIHHVSGVTQKDIGDYETNLANNRKKLAQKWDASQLKAVGL